MQEDKAEAEAKLYGGEKLKKGVSCIGCSNNTCFTWSFGTDTAYAYCQSKKCVKKRDAKAATFMSAKVLKTLNSEKQAAAGAHVAKKGRAEVVQFERPAAPSKPAGADTLANIPVDKLLKTYEAQRAKVSSNPEIEPNGQGGSPRSVWRD